MEWDQKSCSGSCWRGKNIRLLILHQKATWPSLWVYFILFLDSTCSSMCSTCRTVSFRSKNKKTGRSTKVTRLWSPSAKLAGALTTTLSITRRNKYSNAFKPLSVNKIFTLDSSFEKHLYKRNKDYGEPVSDKIKIAEAIITIGEVLTKF